MKTQHQNPDFGRTWGEISILVVNWVLSCLSFFLSVSTVATYIFTGPLCTTTIITLKPCALNVEFHHFILRFNKISLLCAHHWKRGIGGWKEAQRQGDFSGNSNDYFFFFFFSILWLQSSVRQFIQIWPSIFVKVKNFIILLCCKKTSVT
jgi:hypothetical protein